jgi:chromosome segregation ATPase
MADFDPSQGGGLVATITASLLSALGAYKWWRASNSSDAVTRANDEAKVGAIATYEDLVKDLRAALETERGRADRFAEERMKAWEQVHVLTGKIEAMTQQLETQAKQLDSQGTELSQLRAMVAKLPTKGDTA